MVSLNPRAQVSNQQPVEKSYLSFIGGLNTDASPLAFPEGFSSDEENFVLNLDGSRERRLGLTLEEDGQTATFLGSLLNTTKTVIDLGSGQRGFSFEIEDKSYTLAYNPSLLRLIISWTGTLKDAGLPFTKITVAGVSYYTSSFANTSYTVVGSAILWSSYWSGIASFPALAATPAFVVNGSTIPTYGITRTHHWRNVGGNPDSNLLAIQFGDKLRIYPDTDSISQAGTYQEVDLLTFKTDTSTDLEVQTSPINTDYAKGYLFVVGQYIKPFYIEWDSTNGVPILTEIRITERDFWGIVDGYDNFSMPTEEVASHKYNLQNKGWSSAMITDFVAAINKYPSKNMIPHVGYVGDSAQSAATAAEKDWTKVFTPDKLVAELWQDTPAPSGHFIIDPFDTSIAVGSSYESSYPIVERKYDSGLSTNNLWIRTSGDLGLTDGATAAIRGCQMTTFDLDNKYLKWIVGGNYVVNINTYTVSAATSASPIEITTSTTHGLTTGSRVKFASMPGSFAALNGNTYEITWVSTTKFTVAVNGGGWPAYTSGGTVTPTNVIEITVVEPASFTTFDDEATNRGTVLVNTVTNTSESARTTRYRPTSVAFYAGRIWYAGTRHPDLAHKIYFSQIVETSDQYGKCYQQADPTSELISDLIASDGGAISIPEVDNVHELMAYNGRLLVFADNGVWEISGGDSGYFKATGYSIRQIANVGSIGPASIIIAEGTPFFWGEGAIYAITQDPNSGYLVTQDVSTGRIQRLITSLNKDAKKQIQAAYDRNSKKIYWLYDEGAGETFIYGNWLILDLRINAFSKFVNYGPYDIRAIYDIENYKPDNLDYHNIKFFCFTEDRETMYVSELRDPDYEDHGTDATAFLKTGHEHAGDPSRRRYGRYLFTYMKRTEEAWEEGTGGWTPDNPSSMLVRYLWNWSDSNNTGKWSSQQQAYKYRRLWVPVDETELMGEAVIVSRLKVRGTGKSLQIRFDTEAGKDCHLYGWHLRQDVNMES